MTTNYCFEIYTLNPDTKETGWEIENVEVIADGVSDAKDKIKQYPLFDCIITMNDWFHYVDSKGHYATWPLWDGKKILNKNKLK